MSRTNLLFREDPDVVVAGELEKFFPLALTLMPKPRCAVKLKLCSCPLMSSSLTSVSSIK